MNREGSHVCSLSIYSQYNKDWITNNEISLDSKNSILLRM